MKFNPSILFLLAAKASSKVIERKIYFRKTTDLSDPLTTNNWTDATRFFDTIPNSGSKIEYELGKFTIDGIQLIAKNITWMFANILNAAIDEYIECKIEFRIGIAQNNLANDVIYYFSGYVDKNTINPVESTDKVSFVIDSGDALLSKLPAEVVTTQYYDGINAGIILHGCPGIYVTSTNIAGYELSAGVHTISYDYNNGMPQAQLNSGAYVSIFADGLYTLGDGETNTDDRQRITIKVVTAELSESVDGTQEDIIIESSPQNLPKTWYMGISIKLFTQRVYGEIGISNVASGSMEINSFNGTDKRVSFLDHVLKDELIANVGANWAMAYKSASEIFFSSGNRVYLFNPQTNTTTYRFSCAAGKRISKMLYNARNNHLWIWYGDAASAEGLYGDYVVRYDVTTSTLQVPINIPSMIPSGTQLFDFAKFGGGYEYSILLVDDSNSSVKRIDGATMAVTTLFTAAALGYSSIYGPVFGFTYQKTASGTVAYRFRTFDIDVYGIDYLQWHEIVWDTTVASAWTNNGKINTYPPDYEAPILVGAYNIVEDKIYGFIVGSGIVKYTPEYVGSVPEGLTVVDPLVYNFFGSVADIVPALFYDSGQVMYTTQHKRTLRIASAAGVLEEKTPLFCNGAPFSAGNGRVYGIDNAGRIFQFGTQIERFIDRCVFTDQKIKDSLTQALRATNCISTMSFAKSAILYPRNDAAGNPVTSGNIISVTVSNFNDIEKNDVYGKEYDIVAIDNGIEKINYDGVNFNVLPNTLNQRILTIQNSMIPTNVMKDYCKNFYEYFKTKRTLHSFPFLQTMFHFEPMDGATVTSPDTKIPVTAVNKPIYSINYKPDGTMKVGVLI